MSHYPLVSVLMPVYNNARFLQKAVDSILSQTFTDFEFIILDDGSNDESLKILKHCAAEDQRIRLLSRENRGLIKSLNELLKHAQGELIARMDGDDVSLPDRFNRQIEFLHHHPKVVCVGGGYEQIDDQGRIMRYRVPPTTNAEIQEQALRGQTPINHPSMMARRSAMMQVGGYDEAYPSAEILDLLLKLGEVGELANLEDVVIKYRWHRQSISDSKQQEQISSKRKACKAAWERRGIQGQFYESPEPWRPIDRPSRCRFMVKYGEQFLQNRQYGDAFAYSLGAIKAAPWAKVGWKLLLHVVIKFIVRQ